MTTYVGIVGGDTDKFTTLGEQRARALIQLLLRRPGAEVVLVSGHSPVGGVDIWSEEIATELGVPQRIYGPLANSWGAAGGYRDRNLGIAAKSDELHVIVVDEYPANYRGRVFRECYHCHTSDHVKSGGCWTGLAFERLGRGKRITHIVENR